MTQDLFTTAPLPVAPLGDEERIACLRLIRSEQVGPATFRQLINHYGGAARALEALPDLSRRGGRRRPLRIAPRQAAEEELSAAAAIGARPLFTIEPGYPAHLAWLSLPPPMVYVKGRLDLFEKRAIALVGSRRCSAAGQAMARQLAARLSEAGIVVVSGLARGIDGAAHQAAIGATGGTVAVLAGGLDHIYPPEHAELHHQIGEVGCLVSEQPPGFTPRGQDFPRRNRIISGLSDGVVVIEAAERSGSLITARMAADQGRDVFAVPGHPLDPRAVGTNGLLKEGAILVTGVDDVLRELSPEHATLPRGPELAEDGALPAAAPSPPPPADLSETERERITQALGTSPVSLDELVRTTGLQVRNVQISLLELALAGRLIHHGHNLVSLNPATEPG